MAENRTLLRQTQALCPQCLQVLAAEINADTQGKVWMTRSCAEHGEFETMIWPDVEHYEWMMSLAFPKVLPDRNSLRPSPLPCPTACGICQRHQRRPTLIEIEVTQRCNLHCPVCFMSAKTDSSDVPLERLHGFFQTVADASGINTGVQLTGGEPTVRADLPQIVRMARDFGFWGVEVNTNGVVIAKNKEYLGELVEAGVTGIYLQFDGLTGDVYKQIRGADLLDVKLNAVKACRECGVQVVLAMTVVSGINDDQIGDVLAYALTNSDVVAGVALQPAFTSGRFTANRVVPLTMGDVIFMLEDQTDGLVRAEDIWPLGCSHPLCDTGTFLVPVKDVAVSAGATAGVGAAAGAADFAGVDTGEPEATSNTYGSTSESIFAAFVPATRDLTREQYLELYNPASPQGSVFLDILARRGVETKNGVSLIIMNYMDAWTMDLQRMAECSMFVTMPDGSIIPFCSYQLTDCAGKRLFPPWNIAGAEDGVEWQDLMNND
jgi:uncharacterized radical SAM superfamily Fe-S cluster-containing enzyme